MRSPHEFDEQRQRPELGPPLSPEPLEPYVFTRPSNPENAPRQASDSENSGPSSDTGATQWEPKTIPLVGRAIEPTPPREHPGAVLEATELRMAQADLVAKPMELTSMGIQVPGLEVVSMQLADGTEQSWPSFYGKEGDNSRYTGEPQVESLVLPEEMIGRLATFASEVLMSDEYRNWAEHHGDNDPAPFPTNGWNCHEFARRLVPERQWDLEPNEWHLPLHATLHIGDSVAPEDLQSATPYYIGGLEDQTGGHSFVTTQDPAKALNVFGGRQPVTLMRVADIMKRYGSNIYAYLKDTEN